MITRAGCVSLIASLLRELISLHVLREPSWQSELQYSSTWALWMYMSDLDMVRASEREISLVPEVGVKGVVEMVSHHVKADR